MNIFTDSIFAIGLAAKIAGVSENSLRNWLNRDQIQIAHDDDRSSGGWRRLTMLEIFHVSAIGRIVRYGFDVPFASEAVREPVEARMRSLSRKRNIDFSDLKCFIGLRIFVRNSVSGGCTTWFTQKNSDKDTISMLGDFSEVNFANVIIECWERFDEIVQNGELESLMLADMTDYPSVDELRNMVIA